MARARNIKPALFKNELLGEADPLMTLLFTGLWCLADREGRLEDRPRRIKAEILPYRDHADVDQLLDALCDAGFIQRYQVDGQAIIQVLSFLKHQNPHHRETASVLPQASPGLAPGTPAKPDLTPFEDQPQASPGPAPGQAGTRNGSAVLIPDSLNLIPDTGFSDSLIPDSPMVAASASRIVAPPPPKSAEIWEAYRDAYHRRYQVDPVRNAKVNGQLCRVVDRLGAQDAPLVTTYFLENNQAYYVQRMHPVDCLLSDAEKLRTEWATGRRMTNTEARQIDKTANNLDVWERVLSEPDQLP